MPNAQLGRAALDGALKNGALALKLIDAVDPPVEVSVSARMPRSLEEVNELSLPELRALVAQFDADPSRPAIEPS
jgi:hypothetical protein